MTAHAMAAENVARYCGPPGGHPAARHCARLSPKGNCVTLVSRTVSSIRVNPNTRAASIVPYQCAEAPQLRELIFMGVQPFLLRPTYFLRATLQGSPTGQLTVALDQPDQKRTDRHQQANAKAGQFSAPIPARARQNCMPNDSRRDKIPQAKVLTQRATYSESNNMIRHITEVFSTKLIDWRPFVIMGNTMPPRDPEDDEEDEDDEQEDRDDEPSLVREPDEG